MATILVVDDHSISQRLMSFILQQKQHMVVTAANGREALDRLAEQAFELVITDINMPEVNGIELLTCMRINPRFSSIPVVIFTGSAQDQVEIRAHEAGAIAFLTKPASSDEVLATVGQLLSVRNSEGNVLSDTASSQQDKLEAASIPFLGLRFKKNVRVI